MPRPLKVFTVHGHVSHLPARVINGVLGAPSHITQGRIYVVARSKKAASQRIAELFGGRPHSTSVIDEARGDSLVAFTGATTFLDTDSDLSEGTVATSWGPGGDERFAVLLSNDWIVVGHTTYQDPGNPRKHLFKPIFVPVVQEEKPKAEPVRITIELDADADPVIVAELITAGKVFLEPSVDSGRFVFGKVVQS